MEQDHQERDKDQGGDRQETKMVTVTLTVTKQTQRTKDEAGPRPAHTHEPPDRAACNAGKGPKVARPGVDGRTTNGTVGWLTRTPNTIFRAININNGRDRLIDGHKYSTGTSADRGKLFVINRLDGVHFTKSRKRRHNRLARHFKGQITDVDELSNTINPPRAISSSGFGPASVDLDPLTKLSKNITIHNFLT